MAGNNYLQILRGTSSAIAASTDTLLAGQPLYDMTNNLLYVGNGSINTIKTLTPIYAAGIKSSSFTLDGSHCSGSVGTFDITLNGYGKFAVSGTYASTIELKVGQPSTYVNTVCVDQNYVTLKSQSTYSYSLGSVLELRGSGLRYCWTMGTSTQQYECFNASSAGFYTNSVIASGSIRVGSTQYLQLSSSSIQFTGNSGNSLSINNSSGTIGINASSICLETSGTNLVLQDQGAWFGDSINMSTTFDNNLSNVTKISSSGIYVTGSQYTVSIHPDNGVGISGAGGQLNIKKDGFFKQGSQTGSYLLPTSSFASTSTLGLQPQYSTSPQITSTASIQYYFYLQSTGPNITSAQSMRFFYRSEEGAITTGNASVTPCGSIIWAGKGGICGDGYIINPQPTNQTIYIKQSTTNSTTATASTISTISMPANSVCKFFLYRPSSSRSSAFYVRFA